MRKSHRVRWMQGAQENHLRSLLNVNEKVVYRSATPQTLTIWLFVPKEGAAPQFAWRKCGSRSLNFGAKGTRYMRFYSSLSSS